MGSRRIAYVSNEPLSTGATSYFQRESIEVRTVNSISALSPKDSQAAPDLVIADGRPTLSGEERVSIESILSACAKLDSKLLVLSSAIPAESDLDQADAFLVEPFSPGDFIGAVGELLGAEQRRALRMDVRIAATFEVKARSTSATILQLSETGCLVELESPLSVGESINVSFVLPSNRERLTIGSTVVSANELQLLYGIKFDQGYDAERLAVLVFVEHGVAAGS